MKKILLLVTFIIMLSTSAYANNITMWFDGEQLQPLTEPIIKEGRTLVPIRVASEALGAEVDWVDETRMVTVKSDDVNIKLWIDQTDVVVNGETIPIPYGIPPEIQNSTTLVPLRFVAETLGLKVKWVEETREIYMTKELETNDKNITSTPKLLSVNSNGQQVNLEFQGNIDDFTSFRLDNRFVVDISNTSVNSSPLDVNGKLIRQIRFGDQGDGTIRVVLDLMPNVTYSAGVSEHLKGNKSIIRISLFPISEINETIYVDYKIDNLGASQQVNPSPPEIVNEETPKENDNVELNSNITKTQYNSTFENYVNVQFGRGVTDRYRSKSAYIESRFITNGRTTASVPVYSETSTNSFVYGTLPAGTAVTKSNNQFSTVNYYWRLAKKEDLRDAINVNIDKDSPLYYQFLNLEEISNITANELNISLKNRGILCGKGESFRQAAQVHQVNEAYLLSHALLETGNGTSKLATGVLVNSVDGRPVSPKITYNMYGIGAIDSNPIVKGAETAYKNGWFTPEDSIIGGAKFVRERYLNEGANTIYKMRWNQDINRIWKQYATDIDWARKQSTRIAQLYSQWETKATSFDVPEFQNP